MNQVSEAIAQAIRSLEGVEFVHITENMTDSFNYDTLLPPYSFRVCVRGGKDKHIAKAICKLRLLGILSVGNTSAKVKDCMGYKHKECFERV